MMFLARTKVAASIVLAAAIVAGTGGATIAAQGGTTPASVPAAGVASPGVPATGPAKAEIPASLPNFYWLPKDDKGWTVFRPGTDTRIIYVSSTGGDDAAGKAYASGDAAVGGDPFRPVGAVKPFKTIGAAMKNVRDGHPDWLLLRRGDEWQDLEGFMLSVSGRDKTGPFLMSAYGDRPERPSLRFKSGGLRLERGDGCHDLAIVGIKVLTDTLDPKSPRFDPKKRDGGGIWALIMNRENTFIRRILVEDCCMRYCGFSMQLNRTSKDGSSCIEEIAFRRNLVLESPHNSLMSRSSRVLLEENVVDHGGWQVGDVANMFSHNTYFDTCNDTVFRGNMFLRAASLGNKWTVYVGKSNNSKLTPEDAGVSSNLTMDDNLYVEGEVGISMGGNETVPLLWKNIAITNNVFMHIGRAQPTQRDLGWYMNFTDWDGGLVAGNLLIHQDSDKVKNVFGILFNQMPYQGEGVRCRNVSIKDNIIYGLRNASSGIMISGGKNSFSGIVISGNQIQFPGLQSPVLMMRDPLACLSGVSFSNNTHFSGFDPGKWFGIEWGKKNMDFKAWAEASGETGSEAKEVRYKDPSRTVETYSASLGGKADFDDFIAQVRKQSKTNWRKEYTAAAVNAYVREGFRPAEAK